MGFFCDFKFIFFLVSENISLEDALTNLQPTFSFWIISKKFLQPTKLLFSVILFFVKDNFGELWLAK